MSDWILVAAGILLLGYLLTKVVSMTWYRAKLQHFQAVLREIRGDESNGK